MVQVHVERTIGAPPERVFDWLADPANLTAAPLFFKARWAKSSPGRPGVGALREVMVIGTWAHEQFTAYDAPRSYSYLVVHSFPAVEHEGGTVTFTPAGDGTQVNWVSTYTFPARGGGKVSDAISLPLFRSSFRAILARCAKVLESY